jgi:hypothetical protein
MKSEKYLKDENQKTLIVFIVWCIALYLCFAANADFSVAAVEARFRALGITNGLIMVLMPILALVLSGIAPSSLKEVLVFWRIKHPLPGCRAFSKIAPADERIDMEVLQRKLGTLPTDPREQNVTWYKLLKRYSGVTTVEKAHKHFLLSRDLANIAILFAVFGCLGLSIKASSWRIVVEYTAIMLLHYMTLALVARNHGNRLVCNVLAEFISDEG